MKRALFPGTFDPPTLGHLDIIERAMKICDELVIGIAVNYSKGEQHLFSLEEKIAMLKKVTAHIPNVKIVHFSQLVVDFAKENEINFIIRGLRAFSDFEYEFRMALANRKMGGVETTFLMADEKHGHISSSLIRELGHYGSRFHEFVPHVIEEQVYKKLKNKTL